MYQCTLHINKGVELREWRPLVWIMFVHVIKFAKAILCATFVITSSVIIAGIKFCSIRGVNYNLPSTKVRRGETEGTLHLH